MITPVNIGADLVRGSIDAPISIVVYGDYECPYDYLFEHQKALDDSHLLQYAERLGLDTNKFKNEMSGRTYAPLIKESLKSGIDSGVQGTPTFFVNGNRYEVSWDLETFSNFLKTRNT